MPKRKGYNAAKSRAKNLEKYMEAKTPERYIPENESENRISSAGHTQRLVSQFSCPKCSQFGLRATQETVNLFQTKVDVHCKNCGLVASDKSDEKINDQNKKRIIENSEFIHTPDKSPKKRRKTYVRNPL